MSKFSNGAALLVTLSLVSFLTFPVFAQEASTGALKSNPAALRPQLIKQKAQIQEIRKENIRDKAELAREKIASKTAVLRQKLQTFKNQTKATAAQRINTNLNAANQNQTNQMQKHLNIMANILDKLESRVNRATPDIKDPASARAAITSARDVIASTSAAVSAQAGNDYTIQVTSESRIKADAKLQRDKLHNDLLALRKMVKDAKQSVANAIRVTKAEKGIVTNEKEETVSGE